MAIFLTREQIYRSLQRELPEDIYPDGPPSAFFSTADNDAVADCAATGYYTLSRIYENNYPQSATERIEDWVVKVFPFKFDSTVTLQEKRERILAKLRKQPTITMWEILTLVASYVPEGTYVQVVEWGCECSPGGGEWVLDSSELNIDTSLGFPVHSTDLVGDMSTWCEFLSGLHWRLDADQLDVDTVLAGDPSVPTWQAVSSAQMAAFMYEIRIFGYVLTGDSLAKMEQEVRGAEPARSGHITRQNLVLADYNLVNPVLNVDQFSGVNCITRDPSQESGYRGLVS